MQEAGQAARAAIAHNLRLARQERGLTLRAVAEQSGVSKALVSQLENAHANPTVEVLAAVAAALGLSLAEIAHEPITKPLVMRAPKRDSDEDHDGRTLFSTHGGRRLEMYEMLLSAGAVHQSAPHGSGSEEVAYVVTGAVELQTDDWTVRMRRGDAVRFGAAVEHAYRVGGRAVRLITAVSMPNS